jgi:chromosome segregation ATPase
MTLKDIAYTKISLTELEALRTEIKRLTADQLQRTNRHSDERGAWDAEQMQLRTEVERLQRELTLALAEVEHLRLRVKFLEDELKCPSLDPKP